MFKVKLIYFKRSGKYYSEGGYTTGKKELFEIWSDVALLILNKKLPGLMHGHSDFIVSIDVPNHPHNHPHLCV